MNPFNKASRSLIFLTIPVLLISVIMRLVLPAKLCSPALPYLVIFVFAAQLLLLKIILNTSGTKFNRFANRFMIASFVKLILYLTVIIVYFYLNTPDFLAFVLSFLVLYIIYTVFEVLVLLKIYKNNVSNQ